MADEPDDGIDPAIRMAMGAAIEGTLASSQATTLERLSEFLSHAADDVERAEIVSDEFVRGMRASSGLIEALLINMTVPDLG